MTDERERVPRRRRAAALVALVGTAALVGFVLGVLFRHLGEVLLGLLGVAVAVAGGWWVVTERGSRRAIGAAGVAVGLLLLALAVVRTVDSSERIALRLVIVIVLLGVTAICARAAMKRDLPASRARPEGPPRRAVLLCNPRSGGGAVERFGLIELAADLGVETVLLESGRDLETLARDAVERGADCLGVAGGDGSQAVVASVAVEHGLPFVCVGAGTRNHFAADLGLDRADPRQSMLAFRDACERRVDYATVNGRMFVNNVSLGVYAAIVHEDSYRGAKIDTTLNLLPELIGSEAEPFDLRFTIPDGTEVDSAIAVLVSNNSYTRRGTAVSAQRGHLDRGELGVIAATSRSWHDFVVTEFEVRSTSDVVLAGADGEPAELRAPLRFETHPDGLALLVPSGNVEAAQRRSERDVRVRDLLHVALGRAPRR